MASEAVGGEGEEGYDTEQEQDAKTVIAEALDEGGSDSDTAADGSEALRLLRLEDLKTEDAQEPGGYSLREVSPGTSVLIRGTDDDGTVLSFVGVVLKVFKRRGDAQEEYLVDMAWFYKPEDLPKDLKAHPGVAFIEGELVYSNHVDESNARFIRHPCTTWFVPASAPEPSMRAGEGRQRHTRPRPGFVVRRVYDRKRQRLLSVEAAAAEETQLGRDVRRLLETSTAQLQALEAAEAEYDASHAVQGVEGAPFRSPTELGADSAAHQLAAVLASRGTGATSSGASRAAQATQLQRPAQALVRRAGPLAAAVVPTAGAIVRLDHNREVLPGLQSALCTLPAPAALDSLLRALAAAAPVDIEMLAGRYLFVRALAVWVMKLSLALAAPEIASASGGSEDLRAMIVLALQALQALPYCVPADRWLKKVGCYPWLRSMAGNAANGDDVREAANKLLATWREQFEVLKEDQARRKQEMLGRNKEAHKAVSPPVSKQHQQQQGVTKRAAERFSPSLGSSLMYAKRKATASQSAQPSQTSPPAPLPPAVAGAAPPAACIASGQAGVDPPAETSMQHAHSTPHEGLQWAESWMHALGTSSHAGQRGGQPAAVAAATPADFDVAPRRADSAPAELPPAVQVTPALAMTAAVEVPPEAGALPQDEPSIEAPPQALPPTAGGDDASVAAATTIGGSGSLVAPLGPRVPLGLQRPLSAPDSLHPAPKRAAGPVSPRGAKPKRGKLAALLKKSR